MIAATDKPLGSLKDLLLSSLFNRDEIEELLDDKANGTFLVRPSLQTAGGYTIALK